MKSVHRLMITSLVLGGLFTAVLPVIAQDKTNPIPIWKGEVPGTKVKGSGQTPVLYHYPAEKKLANGAAVIVLPGGGYYVHAIDHEGTQVARRLNRAGVTAFVLSYRLRPKGYNEKDAFLDGKRAIRMVRAQAKKFGIDPNRIGVLGFSAGGHLATALGVNFGPGDLDAKDPIDRESSRPDFMVVCYTTPAPLDKRKGREHGWKEITKDTPPAFLWVTHQDGNRPVDTAKFYALLKEAGVDAELHIYGGWGPHGLGLAPAEPGVGTWPDLLETWMRRKGLLTNKHRMALSGKITINGKPLNRGWIKLIPLDAPGDPVAAAYITHRVKGRFKFDETNGPVPGKHRIEVYEVAKDFKTVPTMKDQIRYFQSKSGNPITNLQKDTGRIEVQIQAANNSHDVEVKEIAD